MVEGYGKLYNWYAVNDSRGLCPAGWHVPSQDDWIRLVDYVVPLGYPNEEDNLNGAGNALKSCRQDDSPLGGACNASVHPCWESHETHYGFDEVGFSALPGGLRWPNGHFNAIGRIGVWWCTSEGSGNFQWSQNMVNRDGSVFTEDDDKSYGFSVRCVRNTD